MKGTFRFDLSQHSYGAATAAVRQVFAEWAEVDWFAPPAATSAHEHVMVLFKEHHTAANVVLPDAFPIPVSVHVRRGGWAAFRELCERVRNPNSRWDWKFSALKKLSRAHWKRRGWSPDAHAGPLKPDCRVEDGDLFLRIGDVVFWKPLSPTLDVSAMPTADAEVARWYSNYAGMDASDCIAWQLADASDRLEGNPFLPLLRCYALGFYPFSLGRGEFVLFAFQAAS